MPPFLILPIAFLFAFGQANAATNDNQIKYWISSQTVVVDHNWVGMTVKEKLDISKIVDLKQTRADCNGIYNIECIEKYDFSYNYKNSKLTCSSTMTYTKTRGKEDQNLKLIVVDCIIN